MGLSKNVIAYGLSQEGYHEGRDSSGWNNVEKFAFMVPGMAWVSNDHEPWCAVFDFACLAQGGCGTGGLRPTAGVADLLAQGKAAHRFTEYPTKGALGIIGGGVHTFVVVSFDDTYVYTIEGNTNTNGGAEGDGVHRHTRLRRAPNITGYVIPFYDEFAVSADPEWNGKWLGATTAPAKVNTPMTTSKPALSSAAIRPFSFTALMKGIQTHGAATGNNKLLQRAMRAVHPSASPVDGIWRGADRLSYAAIQRDLSNKHKLNWTDVDCNGVPGPASLHLLFSDARVIKALGANYSNIQK